MHKRNFWSFPFYVFQEKVRLVEGGREFLQALGFISVMLPVEGQGKFRLTSSIWASCQAQCALRPKISFRKSPCFVLIPFVYAWDQRRKRSSWCYQSGVLMPWSWWRRGEIVSRGESRSELSWTDSRRLSGPRPTPNTSSCRLSSTTWPRRS